MGLVDIEFKLRYVNYIYLFCNFMKKNIIEFSKFIWILKDKNIDYKIKWEILGKILLYLNILKKCNFCILEKFFIICYFEKFLLNKCLEFVSICCYFYKFLFI